MKIPSQSVGECGTYSVWNYTVCPKVPETFKNQFGMIDNFTDNCNSLLFGLPKHLVHRLQFAQNCAARLILCGHKHDHVTPLLKELHCLPVEQRIIFKILLLTFKGLNNLCPSYISDLLETYKPARSLRSSTRNLLVIPRSKLKSYGYYLF